MGIANRELLRIVVKEIRLRFDRLFITHNLHEAPGTLFIGRVHVEEGQRTIRNY